MRITSRYENGTVFWRTFNKDDAMYFVGLMEGNLSYGESLQYDHPAGYFKMEMKSNGILEDRSSRPGVFIPIATNLFLAGKATWNASPTKRR